MDILQLISSSGYFGAENVLVQLAAELDQDESCHVVTGVIKNLATPHVEVVDQSKNKGIKTAVFPCAGKFDYKTVLQLRRFIKANKIEIVHSHGYKSNLYSFFASLGVPVKLVATCHNWLGDDSKMKLYSSLDRFFLKRFSAVVAVSLAVQEKILQSGISPERVLTVRNGIDLSRFNEQNFSANLKKDLGIPEHHLVVGTVGRLSSEKGHRHFLNCVEAIEKEYPQTTFLIVGDGKLREELQQSFSKENIIFTGLRNDLPELYNCMDIFVLPSLTEGLPMVLLEAMASYLPVVVTRVGDVPRVVVENETGFLIDVGDEEGMKNCLLTLLGDSVKRKSMGQKGYQRVKEGFSSSQMAADYLQVYRNCLELEQKS
jgi:glycosyltransferase involved in cell wall biosynthesis